MDGEQLHETERNKDKTTGVREEPYVLKSVNSVSDCNLEALKFYLRSAKELEESRC